MLLHSLDARILLAVSLLSTVVTLLAAARARRPRLEGTSFEPVVIYPKPAWKKSSKSAQGNCVEVAKISEAVLVRDSKNPIDGKVLYFSAKCWMEFIGSMKRDQIESALTSN
jgi:hypothetical protein